VCSFGGECDVDIKVAGVTDDWFASVEVASRVGVRGTPDGAQGRLGGDYRGTGDVVVRPAVVVATAAKLFS
jgi:hypothetical protein